MSRNNHHHIRDASWFKSWNKFLLREQQDEPGLLQQLEISDSLKDYMEGLPPEDREILIASIQISPELLKDLKGASQSRAEIIFQEILKFIKQSDLDVSDLFRLKIVISNLIYLISETDRYPPGGSVEDLILTARTTPSSTVSYSAGVEGGNNMDYYRDLDDDLFLAKAANDEFDVRDVNDLGTIRFRIQKSSLTNSWFVEDFGKQIPPDEFLDQMPDGIEDGLRYLGINLG